MTAVQAGMFRAVVLVGPFITQGIPVSAANWRINKTKGWLAMLYPGNSNAELAAAFNEFARAVNGVYQPVIVRRMLMHTGIRFFAKTRQIHQVRQSADEHVMRSEIRFGQRGVIILDPDMVAIRMIVI